MKSYTEVKSNEPVLTDCFFAFSNEQFAEGIKRFNLEGKKIYRGMGGLFGTKEGIDQLMKHYDDQALEIADQCDPQEVYDYEFWNLECSYTNDDREAYLITESYFGERAKTVKRKFAHNFNS